LTHTVPSQIYSPEPWLPKGGHLDADDHGALTTVREFVTSRPTMPSRAMDFRGL
jgi:hypothetical protein